MVPPSSHLSLSLSLYICPCACVCVCVSVMYVCLSIHICICIWLSESLWNLCKYALPPSSHVSWYFTHNVVRKNRISLFSFAFLWWLAWVNVVYYFWDQFIKKFLLLFFALFPYYSRGWQAVGYRPIFVNKVSLRHNRPIHFLNLLIFFYLLQQEGQVVLIGLYDHQWLKYLISGTLQKEFMIP